MMVVLSVTGCGSEVGGSGTPVVDPDAALDGHDGQDVLSPDVADAAESTEDAGDATVEADPVEAGEDGDAGPDAEAGCSLDLDTDPLNCGACGHDCLGASCQNGLCNPTVLAESQYFPQSIAVNLTHIYWTTTTDGVRFCEKDDCAATIGPLAASPAAQSLVATDATVYWVDYFTGRVQSCPADGCGGSPQLLAAGQSQAVGLFIDGTDAFWTVLSGSVRGCTLADCSGSVTTLITGLVEPLNVTAHSGNLYVTDRKGKQVVTCATTGCTSPTALATGEGGPLGVVANDDSLVWTNQTASTLRKCALPDCPGGAETLASGVAGASHLVLGGDELYVSGFGKTATPDGSIVRCPAAGGGCLTLAKGLQHPLGIALDDTFVYWVNTGTANQNDDGSVMRVPR